MRLPRRLVTGLAVVATLTLFAMSAAAQTPPNPQDQLPNQQSQPPAANAPYGAPQDNAPPIEPVPYSAAPDNSRQYVSPQYAAPQYVAPGYGTQHHHHVYASPYYGTYHDHYGSGCCEYTYTPVYCCCEPRRGWRLGWWR
jgi:hypothetical protein